MGRDCSREGSVVKDRLPYLSVEKVIHDLFPLSTSAKKPRFFGVVGRRIPRRSALSITCSTQAGFEAWMAAGRAGAAK
jgi:hypothetical protein